MDNEDRLIARHAQLRQEDWSWQRKEWLAENREHRREYMRRWRAKRAKPRFYCRTKFVSLEARGLEIDILVDWNTPLDILMAKEAA